MRIMLDTNVLLSAVIFRSKMMWNMMARIMKDHRLVLSSYVIDECYEVVERKKPSLIQALDRLFESIPFEMVHTPKILPKHGWFTIRDKDDEKVLYSAISADVDILITGDKDFSAVEVEKPEILTPSQFNEKYLSM